MLPHFDGCSGAVPAHPVAPMTDGCGGNGRPWINVCVGVNDRDSMGRKGVLEAWSKLIISGSYRIGVCLSGKKCRPREA